MSTFKDSIHLKDGHSLNSNTEIVAQMILHRLCFIVSQEFAHFQANGPWTPRMQTQTQIGNQIRTACRRNAPIKYQDTDELLILKYESGRSSPLVQINMHYLWRHDVVYFCSLSRLFRPSFILLGLPWATKFSISWVISLSYGWHSVSGCGRRKLLNII